MAYDFFKKCLAIIGILMGSMAMGLSFSLININLESIQVHFGASVLQLQWIINIYGIFIAAFLVTMGRLGDIFGRKKIYLIGMALFGLSMLGGGCSTSIGMLIGFQGLYGFAGAILLPISQAMLVDIFPEEKKGTAVGIWASSGGICLAAGPLIGGILLNYLDWRSIFMVNVPFALIGFLLTFFFASESRSKGQSKKIDWPGVCLLSLTVGTFILATIQCTTWKLPVTLALYALSFLGLISLLMVEKKMEMPIIREELFKSPTFLICCIGNLCMIAVFWAGIFLIPLYIQKQLHYSPFYTGLLMLGFSIPIGIFSVVSGFLYEKVGPKILTIIGFVILSGSAVMQLNCGQACSPFFIAAATTFLGMGISLISTPTTSGALSAISKNFAGIASGTFVTIQQIGGSLGLAITVLYVRKATEFSEGFHNGIEIMLAISILGLLSAFFIPYPSKKTALD